MKRGYDKSLFEDVVSILMRGDKLPEKYKNHPLHGLLTLRKSASNSHSVVAPNSLYV